MWPLAATVTLTMAASTPSATALTGQPAAELNFTAKINIAEKTACSGALVDPLWVLTAKSCFTAAGIPAAGTPGLTTTVTVGRTDLNQPGGSVQQAKEVFAHPDRDLALIRLTQPVTDPGVKPVRLATTPAAAGEQLTKAGFGRTKTEWVPAKLHTGTFTVSSTTDTAVELDGSATATVCQGDAGSPALRTVDGAPELVAVNSRSWQGGCLGTNPAETRTSALETRVDDVSPWFQDVRASRPLSRLYAIGGDNQIHASTGTYDTAGDWTAFAPVPGSSAMKQISAVTMGSQLRLFAVGTDGRIRSANNDYTAGTWTAFNQVPGNSAITQVAAATTGDKVRLFALSSDGKIYTATGDYTAGTWTPFTAVPGNGSIQRIAAVAMGDKVRLFAVGGDKRIYSANGDMTTGTWSAFNPIASSGIKNIAATAIGNKLHLFAVGNDDKIHTALGDYTVGTWTPFATIASSGIKDVTATAIGDKVRLFAIGSDTQIWTTDRNPNGAWSTFTPVRSSSIKDISSTATAN
ncbi:trypsin-like serine protease [Streptomyces sp. NPDC090025]|uniref:trypsin-like serine protease n=1 Tax=Streptomyces sp. NPDC090025 TaxID=3365922 RepID=UPI00383753F3